MRQIVAVVGPTASGKTALALDIAEALDTEIISADSMQFYRGLEIGTGAPTPEELGRVKHHFVGHLDPSEEMSAADFEEAARGVVAELNSRGKTAVVVGGSGLYVQALIDGLFEGPAKEPAIRERLEEEAEEEGTGPLYDRLAVVDPEYAARIHKSDLRRIVRALEVHEITGTPMSELHRRHREVSKPLAAVQVALDWPRDALYARINARVDTMLEAGMLDEIRRLLDGGYGPHIERLKSLGYREMTAHVRGESSMEEATELMKMYTRRYAKRQLTWFKGDDRVQWLPVQPGETPAFQLEQALSSLDRGAEVRS